MNSQHSSRSAIIVNMIVGKISSIIGWILTMLFGLTAIILITNEKGSGKAAGVILCLIFMTVSIGLIVFGIRTKRRIKRFKRYVTIIVDRNEKSIENIAGSTSKSIEFVMNDLQTMINKKFFANAYIDGSRKEIIVGNKTVPIDPTTARRDSVQAPSVVIACKGCGATNRIAKGKSGECEFCGSPIGAN